MELVSSLPTRQPNRDEESEQPRYPVHPVFRIALLSHNKFLLFILSDTVFGSCSLPPNTFEVLLTRFWPDDRPRPRRPKASSIPPSFPASYNASPAPPLCFTISAIDVYERDASDCEPFCFPFPLRSYKTSISLPNLLRPPMLLSLLSFVSSFLSPLSSPSPCAHIVISLIPRLR